jgi:hypothetical protein
MSEPQAGPVGGHDYLGNVIKAGDTVVYPVRRGSSMWLNKLNVLAVQDTPRGTCLSGTNDTGRRISIYNLSNCVVVGNK